MARHSSKPRAARIPATLGALIAEYRRAHGPDAGYDLHGYAAAHLTATLGRVRLATLTEERIAAYVLRREARRAAPRLINDELDALARVLDWARERGHIAEVPQIWVVPEPLAPSVRMTSPRMTSDMLLRARFPESLGLSGQDAALNLMLSGPRWWVRSSAVPPTRKKAGPRPPIADGDFSAHVATHSTLSDRQRAKMLGLSHDQVKRLRKKLKIPPSRPPSGAQ